MNHRKTIIKIISTLVLVGFAPVEIASSASGGLAMTGLDTLAPRAAVWRRFPEMTSAERQAVLDNLSPDNFPNHIPVPYLEVGKEIPLPGGRTMVLHRDLDLLGGWEYEWIRKPSLEFQGNCYYLEVSKAGKCLATLHFEVIEENNGIIIITRKSFSKLMNIFMQRSNPALFWLWEKMIEHGHRMASYINDVNDINLAETLLDEVEFGVPGAKRRYVLLQDATRAKLETIIKTAKVRVWVFIGRPKWFYPHPFDPWGELERRALLRRLLAP